jgi:hypothetical protein
MIIFAIKEVYLNNTSKITLFKITKEQMKQIKKEFPEMVLTTMEAFDLATLVESKGKVIQTNKKADYSITLEEKDWS